MEPTTFSDVHFACTGCGKCCDAPPTFTIAEAMELYRDFVLTIRLAGPIINARLPASSPAVAAHRILRTHLLAHGALSFQLDTEDGQTFEATLQIYAGAIRAGNDDPCPMLRADNLCGIYERRPQRCRTVPFDYWLPEPVAVANGAERLAAALRRDWKCDVSDTAPVVAAQGVFTPGEYGDTYRRALALMDRQEPALGLVAEAFQRELKDTPSLVAPVVNALGQGQAVDFSFLMVLDGLLRFRAALSDPMDFHRDKLPRHPASDALFAALPNREEFLRAQLPLIDHSIARNLARKRSADRPNTDRLRGLKAAYTTALNG
jgi:Fe-S-cluster containining protein